jgi:hypothetical protein
MQTQEELLIEVTISALKHWVADRKPDSLKVTTDNSFYITGV